MDSQSNCLFITYVEKEGPFLKVWGQTDKNTSLYIEQVLHSFTNQFDNGLCIPHPETLQIGILCCAKYKDNKYYRAKITSLNFLHNRYIEVNFIDYGHKDVVPITNIRSLEGFENTFISIPAQAASFLLAEAVCPRGEWNDAYLDEICKEIRYSEVNFSIIAQVTKHFLVRLFVGVNDLAIILISKGLMRHTSLTTQEAVLLSMMPRSTPQPPMQQSIATYKAFTLDPGSQYEVYVSYVTDGPCNFSVQLKQSEEVLGKLMKEINSMTLTPIEGVPIPGTVCLARCMEDGHICRAVVTNEVDGQFKVFYVDFGNFEVVSLEALYEIPFKYVIPKVMAIRFALAGVEKSTVTLEMQCAFKQFVDNRLIHMKVMPMTARTSLPRCELWDPETQISALDIVNQAASAGYPDYISLNRGFSQPVKISYVFSCNRFYVQLKSKQDDLLRLMLDIQVLCREAPLFSNNMIKVGLPCYALFEGDQQWYRSQIVEVLGGGQAKVQYVDYGNEEVVSISLLKPIEGKQLTILRPQAIECCLNGYQNMEPDVERDNLLEELILEQEFTMKVVEMQGKKALIELIDASNYNVASLLLDKIAVTRSQVSPMLVQAGNKIEHRKSSQQFNSREQFFKQDQHKPDRNRNSFESNETNNENNSWRQNNKGFSNNYDRNKRDNDLNDSTDSDRQSNRGFNKNDRNRNENTRNTEGGSWKQNNKGFNKNQDRYNRDNNKNTEFGSGDEKKSSKDADNWGKSRDERQNFNSRDKDKWSGGKESDTRSFNKRDKDDWGSNRENDKRNFNSREDGDWNSSGNKKSFNSRGDGDWSSSGNKKSFNSREDGDWSNSGNKKSFNSREDGDWSSSGNKKNFNSREDGDWSGNKKNFNSREGGDWENKRDKDNWGNKDDRKNFQTKDKENFRKNRSRFDEDNNDEWNTEATQRTGGFKKKPDFKREASELSSSGSEKSFRKGFKDNFRNKSKPSFNKKFDSSPKDNFGDDSTGDAWNASTSTAVEVPNAAPSTAKFNLLQVDQTEANVIISWFHNPAYFYCQIENTQEQFKQMMEQIQQAYKNRKPSTATIGSPIIGLFPEDSVLYRAEVLETLGSQFKVYYVDFGNVSVIDKVWPIETRFMELPAQAVCCKLHGIEPPTDTWPDANNYGQYFDKKQFLCRFLSTENDRVAVKLESDNEDIGSLLLKDGLATSAIPTAPPELPLLIGQQFRAMLLSVNNLTDFSMSLQSGIVLNCSIFNVSESTETWEDNLKEKLEQILIVYVDDLKEDRLEVTLYDQGGLKIKLIDKDEGAFESVELLCPYLILNSSLSGEITHLEDNTVYIQPSDCAQTIEYLLNASYEYYENTTLENTIVPVEGYVYAVRGSDTNWYRGRVVSFDDTQATVNYVDYGNSEQVEFNAIRELAAEFMEIPIMNVAISIKDSTEDLIGKFVCVNLQFTETGLEGTIQEEQAPVAPKEEEPVPVVETQVTEIIEAAVETPVVFGTPVVLSHTDSPSDFYLQLAQSVEAIEQLQATLQEQITEMPDMENPVVGVLCAAPYSLDQQWYRAQVLDADSDITTVRFVDYGNTDVLDNQATRVKTLPPNLLSLEVHATRCRLKIKPIDEEWTSAASERFEQLCDVELLTAEFINQDEKTNYVELFSNGTNVREILVQENLALADEVLSEANSVGFVSHLNSPSEFWIQLENCVEELEWVAEQLSGAESFSELNDLAPGTLCAALFPDDQMWYRARILSNTVAGIEVLFVDYGNSCTSCSLRELPEDLVMLPPLAQKCSLQKPDSLTSWGPEMARKFSEISADGQTTFNVKKLSTGETASVELLLDGVDVTTLLLPTTEDVCVKSFEGLDEIVLVKGGEELQTKYKLEELADVTWNEDSVKKFAEINDEGKTVFQAEFVSDDTIRLYFGLNDVRLDLNGLKVATPTSSPLKVRPERIDGDIQQNITDTPEHSETCDDINEDIKNIVEDVVEASINTDESPVPIFVNVDVGKLEDAEADLNIATPPKTSSPNKVSSDASNDGSPIKNLDDPTVNSDSANFEDASEQGDVTSSPLKTAESSAVEDNNQSCATDDKSVKDEKSNAASSENLDSSPSIDLSIEPDAESKSKEETAIEEKYSKEENFATKIQHTTLQDDEILGCAVTSGSNIEIGNACKSEQSVEVEKVESTEKDSDTVNKTVSESTSGSSSPNKSHDDESSTSNVNVECDGASISVEKVDPEASKLLDPQSNDEQTVARPESPDSCPSDKSKPHDG